MLFLKLLRILVLPVLLSGFYFCYSQTDQAYFHNLNVDGVPFDQKVNVVFEDSIGFLWIGTNNGLYRYDGHNLVAYRHDVFDPNSIPNNSINSIIEDAHQNLWVGSESYLIFFDREQETFKGFYKNSTVALLEKSWKDEIWAKRRNTELVRILPHRNADSTEFDTHFNYEGGRALGNSKTPINAFVEDAFGRYWLATPDGILPFTKDYRTEPNSFEKKIIVLESGPDQTLFALTEDTLYILGYHENNRKLEVLDTYPNFTGSSSKKVQPTSLAIKSAENILWIGTTGGLIRGLLKENRYVFDHFDSHGKQGGGLRDHRINSVTADRYGNLWIGTPKGVNKYIGRTSIFKFHRVRTSNNSENTVVSSLLLDKNNDMWIGLDAEGLYRIRGEDSSEIYSFKNRFGVVKETYENEGLLVGIGQTLLQSNGSVNQGPIPRFDTLKTYKKNIMSVLPVKPDETWVGVWGGGIDIIGDAEGLSDFKKSSVEKLKGKNVSVMLKDQHQNIWIGTRGDGLYKIDLNREKLSHFIPIKTEGLSSDAILSLLEDDDRLWIGTRGGGLNVYNLQKGTFEWFGEKEGLRSQTISSLESDRSGNIWVSTQNGLARFDVRQNRFVNFGIEDGLTESQFTFNSSMADAVEGILYFGCTDGFYAVHTENFQQNVLKPRTVITDLKTIGAEKDGVHKKGETTSGNLTPLSGTEIRLPYDKNNIAIEFSSLDLTAPHKNRYAYMLEGMNDYWIYTTASNRNANYNDLLPGHYTFKVKSSNSDGVWNENPAQASFVIAPPFWKSNLAYVIYTFFLLSILWISAILIQRWYRLKKNLVAETVSRQKDNEHNRMKMVFFTDISHELRTPLTLIQGSIEKIIRQRKNTLNTLTAKHIQNNALRMGRLIDQIMDIRKFDVGEFKIAVTKNNMVKDITGIKNAFNDFAKINRINYILKTDKKELTGWYDTEILEKILFNLLSNAFKFTPEKGEIRVSVKTVVVNGGSSDFPNERLQDGEYMKCSVSDTGVGISKEDLNLIFDRYYQSTKIPTHQVPGTGIGMELVHKLIENHHGRIKVVSEENCFTEFTFVLPVQKRHYTKGEIGTEITEEQQEEFKFTEIPERTLLETDQTGQKIKPKILLVEDNPELRCMLKEELISDFYVLEAAHGKIAYDLVLNEAPQLIISDLLMPVEDGISLLKRLKKNPEVSHIPIFMLTAKDSHEIKIECLGLGAEDFIEKPFSPEFVKWKIRNTLLARRQLKEKYSKVITAEPSEVEVVSNDEKFIKRLIGIIENSIDDKLLGVEYLASEAGMSRTNLYRKLQAILNETPVNFIKQIRLKRAAQLLRSNDLYISEVAYMTGFNGQKYFSKCFGQVYGMSPTDYIKNFSDHSKEGLPINTNDLQ